MKKFFDLQRFEDINIGTGISNSLVSGTKAADSINNAGSIITIQAGAGNDYIYNTGQIVKIYGEGGADTIHNYSGKNVTIVAGDGNDSVVNGDSDYYLNNDIGDVGNDGIIISLGDGDDTVTNWFGSKVSISGDKGNDYIENKWMGENTTYGVNVTISGGIGNDTIIFDNGDGYGSDSDVVQYTEGDGVDVIYGFNSTDTLRLTANSFSTMTSGNDFFVLFDNGSITLKDAAEEITAKNIVTVKGGSSGGSDEGWAVSGTTATYSNSSGKTLITLDGLKSGLKVKNGAISGITLKNKTVTLAQSVLGSDKAASVNGGGYNYILSGAGKLTNVGKSATLTGSSGKDTLIGGTGKDTIYGGAGNDILSGGNGNDKLFGDAGNDSLNGGKGNDTLTAGAGDDTLTGGKGNDIFVHSSGDDVITDYTAGVDAIKLSGTTLKSSKVSGKDVILTTSGGTLTIKNGKNKDITLIMKFSSSSSSLLAENNFVTADNLSAIVENNLSAVSEIEPQKFETFTVKNDLITYSGK